jgi:DNA-binding transcriptional LysR family regulator
MTFEQLRIFVAVAERGHMTRAAEHIGMTQSAVSAAIRALEAYSGTKLFNRVGRGIELTDVGRRFLPEARNVLERAAAARAALEDLSTTARGALSIAASQTIASYWLPRRLTAFHEAYPYVRLEVTIGNTRQVESAVAEGLADLGLVEGKTRHPALSRKRVDFDRPVLVVSSVHPTLPKLASGNLDLRAISWVIREEGSGTRDVLEELARRENVSLDELRIFLVLPSNEAVREAVEAGAGATIISEHVVERDIAAGALKPIAIDLPQREFAMLRHRDRYETTAQRALVSMLAADSKIEKCITR